MTQPTNTVIHSDTSDPERSPSNLTAGSAMPATAPVTQRPTAPTRPIVLHIGDPIKYNLKTYEEFTQAFHVIRPSDAERERSEFICALKERRWGDFSAIFRPFWGSGGEMGKWDAELISLLPPTVKVFASAGAGFDWADTRLLGERGIIYCNSGLAAAEAVADFAVAMIISTFRHLPWCMGAATIGSAFPSDAEAAFRACHSLATMASHNPRGHILGLIGLGNIGHNIAWKMGHSAFGMRIHYHDVERKPKDVEEGVNVEKFHPVLDDLLSSADCVVLCTPASPDGQPLLTTERFARFRKGARFVNVARGSLVDEEALADALERGHISAAALDVHADEPRVNPRLLRLATKGLTGQESIDPKADQHPGRVMLTCHNAGGTVETHRGFEELSMRNILAVLGGKEPITPVNLQYVKRDDLKVGK